MKIDSEINSLSAYCENRNIPVKYFYQNDPVKKFTNLPKTIDKEIHWYYKKYISEIREYGPDKFYVTELKKAQIVCHNNNGSLSIFNKNNELIKSESTRYKQNNFSKLKEKKKIEGTSVVLSVDSSASFFHWMYHTLPRIDLLNKYRTEWDGIENIILPNNINSKFHKDTLSELKIPKDKILKLKRDDFYEFENLIIPSRSGVHIFVPSWVYVFLNKNFLKKKNDKYNEKIYISRSGAATRKVLNEEEVCSFLAKKGFDVIRMEDFDIFSQSNLFNNAKEIVCPHGAALSNLAYCNPNTKVCEFFSPNYVNPLYWAISNELNLDYSYLIGEGDRPTKEKYPHMGKENITINIKELEKIL